MGLLAKTDKVCSVCSKALVFISCFAGYFVVLLATLLPSFQEVHTHVIREQRALSHDLGN